MIREEFDAQVSRLSVLRNPPDDIEEWWRPLRGVPADRFAAAVDYALDTRAFFPMPSELRADVDATMPVTRPEPAPDRFRPAPRFSFDLVNPASGVSKHIEIDRVWVHHCDDCHDTTRRSYWCGPNPAKDWFEIRTCERTKPHGDHEWVGDCVCKPTNPEYRKWLLRKQDEFERQRAASKGAKETRT